MMVFWCDSCISKFLQLLHIKVLISNCEFTKQVISGYPKCGKIFNACFGINDPTFIGKVG